MEEGEGCWGCRLEDGGGRGVLGMLTRRWRRERGVGDVD